MERRAAGLAKTTRVCSRPGGMGWTMRSRLHVMPIMSHRTAWSASFAGINDPIVLMGSSRGEFTFAIMRRGIVQGLPG